MNKELIEVASGHRPADLYISGGKIINVYSGEIYPANIAVYQDKIAYVGLNDRMVGPETKVLRADGFYLSPGYIEPHAHTWTIFNPVSLMEAGIPLGITVCVSDNFAHILNLGQKGFQQVADKFYHFPMRYFWSVRAVFSSYIEGEEELLTQEMLRELLADKTVLAIAELSNWPGLISNEKDIWQKMREAVAARKRIEGHTAGASDAKLNAVVNSGIHCCHEAITAEQVQEQLRLGLWVMLRNSSLRPDLPELIKSLTELRLDHRKMMLTADGPTPSFVYEKSWLPGMLNFLVAQGINPVTALQLATVNPAVFYGIDDQCGGIAPGRRADILFLPSLDQFIPVKVIANGEVAAENGKWTIPLPELNWETMGFQKSFPKHINLKDQTLFSIISSQKEEVFPVMELQNAVITRQKDISIPVVDGRLDLSNFPELLTVCLVDKAGRWIAKGILKGFAEKIGGLASTFTNSNHLLVIGRNPTDMARAAQQVIDWNGGIALVENEKLVAGVRLPLGGLMSDLSYQQLLPLVEGFRQEAHTRGYKFNEVFYTLLFLTHTALPEFRITSRGLVQVKDGVIIKNNQVIRSE